MQTKREIPTLMVFLFGEAAETAQRVAPERLRLWSEAFEGWLEGHNSSASSAKQARLAWKRLLGERRKLPYEMGQEDIEGHARWMEAEGYSPATIANTIGYAASFYRWCEERGIDGEWAAGSNPAAGVKRPVVQRFRRGGGRFRRAGFRQAGFDELNQRMGEGFRRAVGTAGFRQAQPAEAAAAGVMSREEVEALLGLMRRDETPLGKRDTAFMLARLRMGVPLRWLQRLRRGQIELAAGERRVRWESGTLACSRLPEEVWEAVQRYLTASGRGGSGGWFRQAQPAEGGEVSAGWFRQAVPTAAQPADGGGVSGGGVSTGSTREEAVPTAAQPAEGGVEEEFVFAPLRFPGRDEGDDQAEAWDAGRCVSTSQLLASLKIYGRAAGIAEEKLTLQALRRTAVRLKMEEGATVEEVQAFMGSRTVKRSVLHRMKKLKEAWVSTGGVSTSGVSTGSTGEEGVSTGGFRQAGFDGRFLPPLNQREEGGVSTGGFREAGFDKLNQREGEGRGEEGVVPDRRARPFRPWEGMRHGLYAASCPREMVLEVMGENIQGVEEEIAGLRALMRELMRLQEGTCRGDQSARLGEAYTLAAVRLAAMIKVEEAVEEMRRRDERWEGERGAQFEAWMEMARREAGVGREGFREAGFREAGFRQAQPAEEEGFRQAQPAERGRGPGEEVAATRWVLRNTLDLAGFRQAQPAREGEWREFIHLVEIYGSGCNRLMRLLRLEAAARDQVEEVLQRAIDQAIREVSEEMGWGE